MLNFLSPSGEQKLIYKVNIIFFVDQTHSLVDHSTADRTNSRAIGTVLRLSTRLLSSSSSSVCL